MAPACSRVTRPISGMRTRMAGSQPDAIYAGDEIKPVGEIAMLADNGHQLLELAVQKNFEPVDLALPELPNTLLAARLTAGLELANVLRELLDHGQVLGQKRQTSIRRFTDVGGCGGAAGDQDGIDGIVLG